MPNRLLASAVVLAMLALAATVSAIYMRADVENVPVDRVIANLERMARERPADLELRINLARLHAMAYARQVTSISAYQSGPLTDQPFFGYDNRYEQWRVTQPADAAAASLAKAHLARAIAAYREALAVAPDNGLVLLGPSSHHAHCRSFEGRPVCA